MSEKTEKEYRFWDVELSDGTQMDAKDWIEENQMIGLVDEKKGGIIGYINREHAERIIKQLNETTRSE